MPEASGEYPYDKAHDGKAVPVPNPLSLGGATITVGSEQGSTINVVIQLTDQLGRDMASVACVQAYLSDNADGSTVGTAHSTTPAINGDGLLQELITKLVFLLTSESDGDISIDFVDSSAQSIWLCIMLPDGSLVISDAITHT